MRKLIAIAICLGLGTAAMAQTSLNLHGLNHLTQALSTNPAFLPDSRFTLGIGTSSIRIGANTFSSVNDIFGSQLTTEQSLELVLQQMNEDNETNINTQFTPFTIGFRVGEEAFFNVGLNTRFQTSFGVPAEFIRMLYYGNGEYVGDTISLNRTRFDVNAYSSAFVGLSLPIGDKIRFGVRAQYLIGHANATTYRNEGYFLTDSSYTIKMATNFGIRSSNVPLDSASRADYDPASSAYGANTGFGVNFGLTYELTDDISLNASIIDLGSITWSDDLKDYQVVGEYEFEPLDPQEDTNFSAIVDTIISKFEPTPNPGESYTTRLNPAAFVGGTYTTPWGHEAGARGYFKFFEESTFYAVGVNYKFGLGRWLYLNPSYGFINGERSNVGMGAGIRALGLDIYFMTDNLNSALAYYDSRAFNFQFGLQFTFKPKKTSAIQPVSF